MKSIISLIICCFLIEGNIIAQNIYIKGSVANCPFMKAFLSCYRGDETILIDSTKVDVNGVVYFILKKDYKPGIYIVSFSDTSNLENKNINLLYDNESIEFACDFKQLPASVSILKSDKNKVYYSFIVLKNRTMRQLIALSDASKAFHPNDPFYSTIEKQFNFLQKQQVDFLNNVAMRYRGSFLYKAIKSQSFPKFPFNISSSQRNEYLKEHFLDSVSFSDSVLLNSNIFTLLASSYMQQYKNSELSKSEQDSAYVRAIDILMKRCSSNQAIKSQVTDYIFREFELMNMDSVLGHIYEKYIQSQSCESSNLYDRIKIRLEGNKKMSIGNIAPEINLFDNDSNQIILSAVYKPYTLVIFWASFCKHCVETLPYIKKIYDNQLNKQLEIFAVSVDTLATNWHNAIKNGGYNWINCSDLSGWQGKVLKDYYVFNTPAMFLLDSKKRIIAKPLDINQLIIRLIELKIINNNFNLN